MLTAQTSASAPLQPIVNAAALGRSSSATPAVCMSPLAIASDARLMDGAALSRSSSATPSVVIVPVVR